MPLKSTVPISLVVGLPCVPIPLPYAGSKNSPLRTAFGPATFVTVITTFPLTFQSR